jgi:hypothetical protein
MALMAMFLSFLAPQQQSAASAPAFHVYQQCTAVVNAATGETSWSCGPITGGGGGSSGGNGATLDPNG